MSIKQLASTALIAGAFLLTGQTTYAAGFTDMFSRDALQNEGIDLPPQYGISTIFVNSDVHLRTKDFSMKAGDTTLPTAGFIDIKDLDARFSTIGFTADAYVLPMLRLYGSAGYIEGKFDLNVNALGQPAPTRLQFSGVSYTMGGDFAFAYHDFMFALDGNAFDFDLNVTAEKIQGATGTLRLGRQFHDMPLEAVWIGTEYTSFTHGWVVDVPKARFGDLGALLPADSVRVSLGLKATHIDLVGAHWKLNENFYMLTEYRFDGGSQTYVASLEYRFGK